MIKNKIITNKNIKNQNEKLKIIISHLHALLTLALITHLHALLTLALITHLHALLTLACMYLCMSTSTQGGCGIKDVRQTFTIYEHPNL